MINGRCRSEGLVPASALVVLRAARLNASSFVSVMRCAKHEGWLWTAGEAALLTA